MPPPGQGKGWLNQMRLHHQFARVRIRPRNLCLNPMLHRQSHPTYSKERKGKNMWQTSEDLYNRGEPFKNVGSPIYFKAKFDAEETVDFRGKPAAAHTCTILHCSIYTLCSVCSMNESRNENFHFF